MTGIGGDCFASMRPPPAPSPSMATAAHRRSGWMVRQQGMTSIPTNFDARRHRSRCGRAWVPACRVMESKGLDEILRRRSPCGREPRNGFVIPAAPRCEWASPSLWRTALRNTKPASRCICTVALRRHSAGRNSAIRTRSARTLRRIAPKGRAALLEGRPSAEGRWVATVERRHRRQTRSHALDRSRQRSRTTLHNQRRTLSRSIGTLFLQVRPRQGLSRALLDRQPPRRLRYGPNTRQRRSGPHYLLARRQVAYRQRGRNGRRSGLPIRSTSTRCCRCLDCGDERETSARSAPGSACRLRGIASPSRPPPSCAATADGKYVVLYQSLFFALGSGNRCAR